MIEPEKIPKITSLCKLLGEPTRLRLLCLLEDEELSGNQICERLEVNKQRFIQVHRMLRFAGLVGSNRAGHHAIYRLEKSGRTAIAAMKQLAKCQ